MLIYLSFFFLKSTFFTLFPLALSFLSTLPCTLFQTHSPFFFNCHCLYVCVIDTCVIHAYDLIRLHYVACVCVCFQGRLVLDNQMVAHFFKKKKISFSLIFVRACRYPRSRGESKCSWRLVLSFYRVGSRD